jgi:hypothetical protein
MDNIRIEELAEPSGELHVEAPLEFGPADAAGDEALGGADAGP